ncbi:MAG: hypothetical protein FJ291_22375 [Planctomycetes bacterium]|nr:hypothetical protein [Planctomycetota bacterium]
MNATKFILVAAAVLACTILPILATIGYEAVRTQGITHEVLARAPERGNYLPRHIKAQAGKLVRLRIRNVDTVTHGFTLPDFGIDVGDLKAGHSTIVEFTPQKPGTHAFYCTVWCSDHHLQMRGTVEVVAP